MKKLDDLVREEVEKHVAEERKWQQTRMSTTLAAIKQTIGDDVLEALEDRIDSLRDNVVRFRYRGSEFELGRTLNGLYLRVLTPKLSGSYTIDTRQKLLLTLNELTEE